MGAQTMNTSVNIVRRNSKPFPSTERVYNHRPVAGRLQGDFVIGVVNDDDLAKSEIAAKNKSVNSQRLLLSDLAALLQSFKNVVIYVGGSSGEIEPSIKQKQYKCLSMLKDRIAELFAINFIVACSLKYEMNRKLFRDQVGQWQWQTLQLRLSINAMRRLLLSTY
ncbi:MAG: hypothetical protein R2813_10295 [Flavobacteriales bacterium]